MTRFTELTGCRVAVQQAPMGSVSTAALAVAVADAGGVGSIGTLGMSAAQVDKVLGGLALRTRGVLAANFLTAGIDPEAVTAAAAHVRIVDFYWTDPDPALVSAAHQGGALACWQVGSLAEARAAVAAGCDVVAVQGIEAGGHIRGSSPLLPLLSSVLDVVDVPVLAAGGIGDAQAFAAALAAGADGVRAGTRFVAAAESGAHPLYRQAVVDASAGATEISGAFADCPLCATSPRARVLRSCVLALHGLEGDTAGSTVAGGREVAVPRGHGTPPGPSATGHVEAMAMYAGESAALISSVEPAAAILEAWAAAV